ncbi:MAG TPA: HEAT repeat domain-containing protein [Steroidobacteraceae bacterium]|nr:HEAT repeat domain-containing protein [Steroidobacteraceae bacterium]
METQPDRSRNPSPAAAGESAVLRRARAGEPEAFRQLVTWHQAQVFAAAARLTGEPLEAAALARDAFVKLHVALARIASPAHLARWLARAVSQQGLGRLRAQAGVDEVLLPLEPGADFTASVMARVEQRWSHRRQATASARSTDRRRRNHGVLFAALLVLAAVLALLALRWPAIAWRPLPAGSAKAKPAVVRQAPGQSATSLVESAAARTGDTTGAPSSMTAADIYPHYSVIVMPLRQEAQDPAARLSMEMFYAALLDELRKVPDLTLLVPGITAAPVDGGRLADYLLTVTGLATTALPSGDLNFHFTEGAGAGAAFPPNNLLSAGVMILPGGSADSPAAPASSRQWPVEIRMQPIGQPESGSFTSTFEVGADGAAGAPDCLVNPEADGTACITAARLAARQVEMLRTRFFPDLLANQQLLAEVRDDDLPDAQRNRALADLLGTQLHGRAQGLDTVGIDTIVEYAAVLHGSQRAQLWRSLRNLSHPDLVDPLMDSLRRDPDARVRFEALATLAANYRNEPRVRAAIETASREDAQELVRMAARRVLDGEAAWRSYVIATLKNTDLAAADRLAPLLTAVRSAVTPAEAASVQSLVNDRQVSGLLAGMIRDDWFDATQGEANRDALGLLANAGNPAAFDLFVQIQPEGTRPEPPRPEPAPRPVQQISAAQMAWLMDHRNNPRVRWILQQINAGNTDPQLEAMIEQLQRLTPPRR